MLKRIIYILIFLYIQTVNLLSQESDYKFTLIEAEKMFLKNNLLLLSGKFDIDTKRAGVIQAGLYANPNIFLEQNVFNDKTDRYLDPTRNGQTVVQIQQLFLLGGKIDKRIRAAEATTKISEERFYDLLRALKFELRNSFFGLHFLNESIRFYDRSIDALKKTVVFVDEAYKRRAVLLSEVLRIKALLFFLENERTEIVLLRKQKEASLRVLLNNSELITKGLTPLVDLRSLDDAEPIRIKYGEVLDVAMELRPDLRAAVQGLKYQEANLELQKANAIPDLAFGPVYNRAGTYIPNYFGLTAQLNLPIFDRNQGNIQAAEKSILQQRSLLENQRITVENEVQVAYQRAIEKDRVYKEYKDKFTDDYSKLALLMISNYEKRYLTIIEFADFFETYRSSIQQMLRLQIERAEALEGLNYAVGKSIIKVQSETEW